MKQLRIVLLSIGLAGLLMVGLVTIRAPKTAQALPPRPTPIPTVAQPAITGGFIELTIDGEIDEVWTAVQWQDPNTGDWHPVDGWQGTPNSDNEVRWYVGQEDLDSGPFRWLVYDAPDGNVLAIGEAFQLPKHAGQMVVIEITIP